MKNIHLLKTEKPSRLYKDGEKLKLDIDSYGVNNQNIYITSDEEIKEGDWIKWGEAIYKANRKYISPFKKIILTTDQDLIADGVQAIDDEFLEWFVQNPSCEFVEVTRDFADEGIKGITYYGKYFIIIPKEESKQEGYICPHTKIQCDDECCVSAEDCHITSSLASGMVDCDEPKQETLEKAANNWVTQPVIGTKRESFIAGAKWQFERMEGLVNSTVANKLEDAIRYVTMDLLADGFDDTDIKQYLESVVGFVVDDTVDPL
jgi:hypothetical protein